jgi:hypothetical protein
MFKVVIFFLVALLTFLIGGFLQTVTTAIGNTVCTVGSVFALFAILLFQKRTEKRSLLPYIYLVSVIFISSIINNTNFNLSLLYVLLFVFTPFTIYTFINNNIQAFSFKKVLRCALYVGLLQMPVILLQERFSAVLSALSARKIGVEDVDFGTFFFANDHAVCFFLLTLIIILLFQKTHLNGFQRIAFIMYFALTIIFADSNISTLLLGLTFAYYFILNFRYFFMHFLIGALALSTIVIVPYFSDLVDAKIETISGRIDQSKESFLEAESAVNKGLPKRSDVVLYFENQPFKVWGDGPYSYYDPIKKVFPKFANFSLYLWFYEDIGIMGIFSVFIIYAYMYFKNNKLFSYRLIFLGLILIYSYFANTFSDLAFNIIYCFAIIYKPENDVKLIAREQAALEAANRQAEESDEEDIEEEEEIGYAYYGARGNIK